MNFVTFSDFFDNSQLKGEIFCIFVIAIAAAEAQKKVRSANLSHSHKWQRF
jgi:NADH:ubiquinone oxidoreductase subunit K